MSHVYIEGGKNSTDFETHVSFSPLHVPRAHSYILFLSEEARGENHLENSRLDFVFFSNEHLHKLKFRPYVFSQLIMKREDQKHLSKLSFFAKLDVYL